MPIQSGFENRKKFYALCGLLAVIAPLAWWQLRSPVHATAPQRQFPVQHAGKAAEADPLVDPAQLESGSQLDLNLDGIAGSESVRYEKPGRNIFDLETPVAVEEPLASVRPLPSLDSLIPTEPKPPEINLKYFGYVEDFDRNYRALVMNGSESLLAENGEIVFHRYRVVGIHPASLQVTDMTFKNTQTIPVSSK